MARASLGAGWGDASLVTAGCARGPPRPRHLISTALRGKGVATAAGVAFALAVPLGIALLGVWLAFALLFRIASLASLAAAVAAPPLGLYFIGNGPEAWALFPIALLLIWRHRENIRKLLAGQERKIGS
jgi:glycerol-3-phosphate acyltransferase PlsY